VPLKNSNGDSEKAAQEYVRQVRLLLTLFDEARQRYEGHRAIAGQQAASEA
jgi:hypothetical protein